MADRNQYLVVFLERYCCGFAAYFRHTHVHLLETLNEFGQRRTIIFYFFVEDGLIVVHFFKQVLLVWRKVLTTENLDA
jgi:hypothetical protein